MLLNSSQVLTGKHGDFINVVELAKVFAVEAGPKICNEDLGALVQPDPLPVEDCLVAEAVEVLGDQVDKAGGRVVGAIDAIGKAASEFLGILSVHKTSMNNEDSVFTLQRTSPASRKHCTRSLNNGISSSVVERKTCRSTSSVHSSSFTQKSGVVIGIPAILVLGRAPILELNNVKYLRQELFGEQRPNSSSPSTASPYTGSKTASFHPPPQTRS